MEQTADDAIVDQWLDVDDRKCSSDDAKRSGLPRLPSALRELSSLHDVDEVLQRAVDLTTELIAGCSSADVMFWSAGGTTTPVSTDPLAITLDKAQTTAGEGPCLLAASAEPIVIANDLAADERFPRFGPRAAELGVRSAVSHQLFLNRHEDDRMGALNLYGSTRDAFDDAAIKLGAVFAAHCSAALAAAITREGFQTALESRDVIGQAKGILMAYHQISAASAFDMLRESSQDLNLKLRDVAVHVTTTGALP